MQLLITGLKVLALGFGLKDEALTLRRAAVVGDVGIGVEAEDPEPFAWPLPLPFAGPPAFLNGGMAWMLMLIGGLATLSTAAGLAGAAAAAAAAAAATVDLWGGMTASLMPPFRIASAGLVADTFAVSLSEALAAAGFCCVVTTTGRLLLGVGLRTELMPMVRAPVVEASLLAFSLICFCFSSSLARIGTKSSGIGLFS